MLGNRSIADLIAEEMVPQPKTTMLEQLGQGAVEGMYDFPQDIANFPGFVVNEILSPVAANFWDTMTLGAWKPPGGPVVPPVQFYAPYRERFSVPPPETAPQAIARVAGNIGSPDPSDIVKLLGVLGAGGLMAKMGGESGKIMDATKTAKGGRAMTEESKLLDEMKQRFSVSISDTRNAPSAPGTEWAGETFADWYNSNIADIDGGEAAWADLPEETRKEFIAMQYEDKIGGLEEAQRIRKRSEMLSESLANAREQITKEMEEKGYELISEDEARSTNSAYLTFEKGNDTKKIRISDHGERYGGVDGSVIISPDGSSRWE